MATPFLGEIKTFSCNFAPKGYALANGQQLPINQNQALFSLYGTTYGGDGRVNFALPNLQGRMPIYTGNGFTLGEMGGAVAHTLNAQEMPQHLHLMMADNQAGVADPTPTSRLANSAGSQLYGPGNNLAPMIPAAIGPIGGSQAHNNMQPYLCITFCVALQGVFPSQN